MSQIVNTLPALPENMPYDNYFLYHVDGSDTYRCSNFDYFLSNTLDASDTLYYHRRIAYDYSYDSEQWLINSNIYDGSTSFGGDFVLIASTVDVYNSNGTLYCSATENNYFTSTISLISTSITSSTLTSVLNETKILLPILVVALVAVIAFRKSWNFIRGAVRGV